MKLGKLILAFLISIISKKAISAENVGQAVPWGLNLREPFSPFMAESVAFHNELLWLVSIISLFILCQKEHFLLCANKSTFCSADTEPLYG